MVFSVRLVSYELCHRYSFPELSMMKMANGHSQCIRSIVRCGNALEFEQQSHHLLHLMFLRIAVTDHRLLDQARRVFMNFKSRLFSYQQCDSTHLTEFHADLHVGCKERILESTRVRSMLRDRFLEP